MNLKRPFPLLFLCLFVSLSPALALTPVEDSSEELFWSDPMTVHDYKKKSDLHNISVSLLALSELEFVRLGDGLADLSLRRKERPLSQSLDSVEYAYGKLPQIEPVRRLGQLFDALQLRQLSLSDARVLGVFLSGQGMGGVTPVMQIRIYKLVVFLEDVIYDIDRAVMFPVNWGISGLREKPTRVQSLGYLASGLGFLRWEISSGLRWLNKELVRVGSNIVMGFEKIHDAKIRKKLKKKNRHMFVYSKMPLSVYEAHQKYLTGKNKASYVGSIADWYELMVYQMQILPDKIQSENAFPLEISASPSEGASEEVIVAAEYGTWEKVPEDLKPYVISADELAELIKQYRPPSSSKPV